MKDKSHTNTQLVIGVVDPSGSGGVRLGSTEHWTLKFSLETWRTEGGPLSSTPLVVHRTLTDAELRDYMKRIEAYAVLSTRVLFTDSGGAELVELLDNAPVVDPELSKRAAHLSTPTTLTDDRFGTLTLDRRVSWFEASTRWCDSEVRLALQASEGPDLKAALRAASELWDAQQTWDERIKAFAVERLLPLKNGTWLDEDEDELTAEQFVSRMTLNSINVSPAGEFDFWHGDGDLFWGHSILVSGNLADGPTDADIPG